MNIALGLIFLRSLCVCACVIRYVIRYMYEAEKMKLAKKHLERFDFVTNEFLPAFASCEEKDDLSCSAMNGIASC